ncbi:MAG TPA: hypothetical protein VHX38_18540 [Pseudonocardiaceae bacterium]|jgi:hypothetical protein|nr:hypothetical protein [Pseudonocardiaceae bacterium]
MRTLMSGAAWVSYSQIYVQSAPVYPELSECFAGQRNGLCGAAVPGYLFLTTGLHTGEVGFTVELHEQAPPPDEAWEDVVEASFRPEGPASLVYWAGEGSWPLDLAQDVDYRVRYSAFGMDAAREQDTRLDDEPQLDRYLLQFWPSPPAPDAVVKQTSRYGVYWHAVASEQPLPPTPEERAAAEREQRAERERQREQQEEQAKLAALRREEREWGGRLPGERLRRTRGSALSLARLDRPLLDALAELDPADLRLIARWVVKRAYVQAQLADIDWIAPALAALERDQPLPAPFDDSPSLWDRLLNDRRVPRTTVTSLDGRHDNMRQQAMALPAILAAIDPDPLQAACGALWHAAVAFGRDACPMLFAEVRAAFPALLS